MKKLLIITVLVFMFSTANAAQILLVNAETEKAGQQYLGDVVGIYKDTHVFSSTEMEKFNVLKVKGTVQEVQSTLESLSPKFAACYKWASDNDYHWTDPDGETITAYVDVYQPIGSNKWFILVDDFKYPYKMADLTSEEKQALETVKADKPSIKETIGKMVKDVSALPKNYKPVHELTDTKP